MVAYRSLVKVARTYGLRRATKYLLAERVIFPLALRFGSAQVVALSLRLALRPILSAEKTVGASHKLIVLPKLGGDKDLDAAWKARETLPFVPLKVSRSLFVSIMEHKLGESLRKAKLGHFVQMSQQEKLEWSNYVSFLEEVLQFLGNSIKIGAFVTSSYRYSGLHELGIACGRQGIPFLVVHKESFLTPSQRASFERYHTQNLGALSASAIAVYSQEERNSLLHSFRFDSEDLVVTGCGRIDEMHAARIRERSLGPVITLFTIDSRAGIVSPVSDTAQIGTPDWSRMATEIESWFIQFAVAHPEQKFVVKSKLGTREQVHGRLPRILPRNVEVIFDGDGGQVVFASKHIVAFNSTVILEALARGSSVSVPDAEKWFSSEARSWSHDFAPPVQYFSEKLGLVAQLEDSVRSRNPSPIWERGSIEALSKHAGNADGLAGARVLSFLESRANLP